jgi:hypothetical protein
MLNNPNPLQSRANFTNLNISHFKMGEEAMGLKIIASRSLEWHHLPTKFHENLPSSSKVISGGHTDTTHTHTDL